MIDSRALLEAVCLTLGAFVLLSEEGTGRALNVVFFSLFCSPSPSASAFCMRASRAAFSFAATASPDSWNVLWVGGFVDLMG